MTIKPLCFLLLASPVYAQSPSTGAVPLQPAATSQAMGEADIYAPLLAAPGQVRGIHLSAWGSGSSKLRRQALDRIKNSVINSVAIALKETDGKIYIPGVPSAAKYGAYAPAIARPEEMMADFREAGLYTIGRIVVFKDKVLPKARPDLAVRTPSGELWRASNGDTWADPYSREVWDYVLEVALRAAELGFDEIQFDYIRHPTEGNTSLCRYSKPHSQAAAVENLSAFLAYARKKIPGSIKISAAIFGLTTSSRNDMGIGQSIYAMAASTDFISPMMYPSHYNPGEYGLKNPDAEPFKVIDRGLRDARRRLPYGDYAKIRPYLQDFSLRHKYGPQEVRAQLIAARRNYLPSWILWNAGNRYNWEALTPQAYKAFVDPAYEHGPSPAPKP